MCYRKKCITEQRTEWLNRQVRITLRFDFDVERRKQWNKIKIFCSKIHFRHGRRSEIKRIGRGNKFEKN